MHHIFELLSVNLVLQCEMKRLQVFNSSLINWCFLTKLKPESTWIIMSSPTTTSNFSCKTHALVNCKFSEVFSNSKIRSQPNALTPYISSHYSVTQNWSKTPKDDSVIHSYRSSPRPSCWYRTARYRTPGLPSVRFNSDQLIVRRSVMTLLLLGDGGI